MRASPKCSAIALLLVVGCSRTAADVERTYRPDARRAESRSNTIVFVPGIMGSALVDSRDGHEVWGSFDNRRHDEEQVYEIALPFAHGPPVSALRDSIVPEGELLFANLEIGRSSVHPRTYPGVLEGLLEALMAEGHHRPKPISLSDVEEGKDPIIGFGYDWRREIASEAKRLHEVVVSASEERRRRTGNPRIDVIAHSMGTQLVRWYLRYGTASVPTDGSVPKLTWAGVEHVERVLFVGAPNSGSAKALEEILLGSHVNMFLPSYPPAVVSTFPGGYELLPRMSDELVVWAHDGEPVDIYDVKTWERLSWGAFQPNQDEPLQRLLPETKTRAERLAIVKRHIAACLENARAFHRALDRPAAYPATIRTHAFVGDFHKTELKLEVDRETGYTEWVAYDVGDGTVTRTSALGLDASNLEAPPRTLPDSVHFLRAEHIELVADSDFLNQALYLLLEAPDPPPP